MSSYAKYSPAATPSSGGTVTNVSASSPLASSGGATPNISLTGVVAVANGGTNSSTALSNGLVMVSSSGKVVESNTAAENITLQPHANTVTDGDGFIVAITAGSPNGAGAGAEVDITASNGGTANSGGNIQITSGNSDTSFPGDIHIQAGSCTVGPGEGGYLYLSSGTPAGGSDTGHVQITTGATLVFDFKNGACYFGNYHIEPSQQSVTASTGSTSVDLSKASGCILTLGASTTLSFSNPQTGGAYVFKIIQGAAAYTVAWPAAVKWPNGVPPIISTAASAIDKITLYYDGSIYIGTFAQNFS